MTIISTFARHTPHMLAAGLALTLSAGAAQAREPAPAPPAATTMPSADVASTKRYCVVTPPITGTMLSRKTCMTRAQWLRTGFDPLDPK